MLKPPTDKISAETREKLLALAEFIETDTKYGFYMGIWLGKKGEGYDQEIQLSDAPECGTTCCIGGHWAIMIGDEDAETEVFWPDRGTG